MDDDERARHERLLREQDDLRRLLERSRERVGVEAGDLRRVVAAALSRSGFALDAAEGVPVGAVETFAFDPAHPAFAAEAGWGEAFDDLRVRPRKRGERVNEWRRDAPLRTVSFAPPILPDGRDAPEVVQVHLEHRLVRRLLSRFISQGFQSSLSRVSAILGPGAQPRVVLLGRLCVYGEGAARLHEEIIPVTAVWTEADRGREAAPCARRQGRGHQPRAARRRPAGRPPGARRRGGAHRGAGRAGRRGAAPRAGSRSPPRRSPRRRPSWPSAATRRRAPSPSC